MAKLTTIATVRENRPTYVSLHSDVSKDAIRFGSELSTLIAIADITTDHPLRLVALDFISKWSVYNAQRFHRRAGEPASRPGPLLTQIGPQARRFM